jgi:hypothetical protein
MPGTVRPVTDERDGLLAFLEQQRDAIRIAVHGLTDEQARARPSASAITLGGLVKHIGFVERGWIVGYMMLRQLPDDAGDWESNWRLGEDETLASALERYAEVARETEAIVASVDLDMPVPVPRDAPWFPQDVDHWSARWVLLHLIEETAKHAGHADIIRESLDGRTFYELMAAKEGWQMPESWTPRE